MPNKNKVFSAKRNFIEFDYEFINGESATFTYTALSQKEVEAAMETTKNATQLEVMQYRTKQFKKQLSCEKKTLVAKLLKEQYENANTYELIASLDKLLSETKTKK